MPKRKPDIYGREIARLTKHPEQINTAWWCGVSGLPKSPLFWYLTPTGGEEGCIGCPTLVKKGIGYAPTKALTKAVREAPIPNNIWEIRPHHLKHFAAIQRLADRTIRKAVKHAD